jgi:hypothetical protein
MPDTWFTHALAIFHTGFAENIAASPLGHSPNKKPDVETSGVLG